MQALGRALVVGLVSVTSVAVLACGGPPRARAGHEERLPADGSPGGPAVSELPPKAIPIADWNRSLGERLEPACDAREGNRKADATKLQAADKVLKEWMAFKKAKGQSRTANGKEIGGKPEPTRVVDSLGMTCSPGKNTVEVNGVQHPFDIAWVVSGVGVGPTLNGEDGAGRFVMIQAVSFKEKNVVLAKAFVPSDGNDDTDDTVVVSDLASYLPENADEPVVRAVSERKNPFFETFIFTKGAKEGFTYQAPQQKGFGKARYLAVGRFAVDNK